MGPRYQALTYDLQLDLRGGGLGPPVVGAAPVQPAVRGRRRRQPQGPLGRAGRRRPRRHAEGGARGEDRRVGPVLRRAAAVVKAERDEAVTSLIVVPFCGRPVY